MKIDLDNEANEQFTKDIHDIVFDALDDGADPVSVVGTLLVASFDLVQRGGGDPDDFVGIARSVAEVGEQQMMLEALGEMDDVKEALENDDVDLAKELLEEHFDADVEVVEASSGNGGDSDDHDRMFQ